MQTYVILMNLTQQGITKIKEAPKRIEAVTKALEKTGGKLIALYTVMGKYDYVAIAEVPSDEVAMAQLLGLGMAGNVRTTTLKAFSMEKFGEIIKAIPSN